MQGNYEQLALLEREINEIKTESPALKFLLGDKIKRFYQMNAMRLEVGRKNFHEMMQKHIVIEEGKWKRNEDNTDWVFKSEEDKAQYLEAYEAFAKITFEIYS